MPDLNDFHAFTSTTSGGGGAGCSSGCLPWVLGVLAFLWFIGKLHHKMEFKKAPRNPVIAGRFSLVELGLFTSMVNQSNGPCV